MEGVSIIIISYKKDALLDKIYKSLKKQIYHGKKEIILISQKKGLAQNINEGIKKSKYNIVISLHADCIPNGNYWLKNLVEPFKNKKVVATVSKVHLPLKLWNKFGIFTRAMTLKEKGTITPLMDEKGCAYRKKTLFDVNLFNEKDFRTAGEDFDMYLKLKEKGTIAYPNSEVIHMHPTTLRKRLIKTSQNANGFGTLVSMYGTKMPHWYLAFAKAIPILGMAVFVVAFPFRKGFSYYLPYLLMVPLLHFYYSSGFWKGLLMGKQTAKSPMEKN